MWANIKGELAAAVAVAGALFVATGYGLVWAKVVNAGLPVQPILSALPTTVFISSAVEALAFPLILLVPFVIGVVVLRDRDLPFPGFWWWLLVGLMIVVVTLVATSIDRRLVTGWNADATTLTTEVAIGVVLVSAILGKLCQRAVGKGKGDGPQLQAMAGLILVLSIGAVAVLRIAEARTVDQPLPYVGVFLDTQDCPPVFDVLRRPYVSSVVPEGEVTPAPKAAVVTEQRCYVGGFYLGESSDWMFVAKLRDPAVRAPGRLLLLPRSSAQIAAAAKSELDDLPPPESD
jgi:hypothetical protein